MDGVSVHVGEMKWCKQVFFAQNVNCCFFDPIAKVEISFSCKFSAVPHHMLSGRFIDAQDLHFIGLFISLCFPS